MSPPTIVVTQRVFMKRKLAVISDLKMIFNRIHVGETGSELRLHSRENIATTALCISPLNCFVGESNFAFSAFLFIYFFLPFLLLSFLLLLMFPLYFVLVSFTVSFFLNVVSPSSTTFSTRLLFIIFPLFSFLVHLFLSIPLERLLRLLVSFVCRRIAVSLFPCT